MYKCPNCNKESDKCDVNRGHDVCINCGDFVTKIEIKNNVEVKTEHVVEEPKVSKFKRK
jgi:transcription initiation factor TFIIIB Brf1 subunit/transcription initiation factor TFIIB